MTTETMWANGLAAVPLAALVLIACMTMRLRASTRHLLWAVVLATLVVPPLINARHWGERIASHWTPAPHVVDADRLPEVPSAVPTLVSDSSPSVASGLDSSRSVTPPLRFEPLDVAPVSEVIESTSFRAPYHPTRTRASFYLPEPREAPGATSAGVTRLAFGEIAIEDPALEESAPVPSLASRWASALGDVRRALTSLPPLPALVWWSGCASIVLVGLLRIRGASRLLRRAVEADDATKAVVRAGSTMLGLKRPPETRIVDATVSPMVVCTLPRPVLVLPRALWRDLDGPGRLAVICHECAHLRRGDHWLCWLDLIIGCLYWWHPVVWFVRRRMRDEADLACDAWVIDALPHARRAYAEALLETKAFVSMSRTPAPALGATSAGARNFTRRITMVMTKNAAPKLTARGGALVALVAAAGLFVTPVLACPPKEKKTSVTKVTTPKPPSRVDVPDRPTIPAPPEPVVPRAVEDQPNDGRSDERDRTTELEARIRDLEAQLDAATSMLSHVISDADPFAINEDWGDVVVAELSDVAHDWGDEMFPEHLEIAKREVADAMERADSIERDAHDELASLERAVRMELEHHRQDLESSVEDAQLHLQDVREEVALQMEQAEEEVARVHELVTASVADARESGDEGAVEDAKAQAARAMKAAERQLHAAQRQAERALQSAERRFESKVRQGEREHDRVHDDAEMRLDEARRRTEEMVHRAYEQAHESRAQAEQAMEQAMHAREQAKRVQIEALRARERELAESQRRFATADGSVRGFEFAAAPESVSRVFYKVPEGRRDALTALMLRDDVPIRVEPHDEGIVVHANAEQHRRFKSFVTLITSTDEVVAHRVSSPGTLEAFTALMIRPDVPVLVEPSESEIRVHGPTYEQKVVASFLKMIDGGEQPITRSIAPEAREIEAKQAAVRREIQSLREKIEATEGEKRDALQRQLGALKAQAEVLRHAAPRRSK